MRIHLKYFGTVFDTDSKQILIVDQATLDTSICIW